MNIHQKNSNSVITIQSIKIVSIFLFLTFVFANSICHAQIPYGHQIQAPTGSVSYPSIIIDGDSDTGIYGDGNGNLGVVTGI